MIFLHSALPPFYYIIDYTTSLRIYVNIDYLYGFLAKNAEFFYIFTQ